MNYHGLGETLYAEVIEKLDEVTEAYRGTKNAEDSTRRENYFLPVSNCTDNNGNMIIVPIYIDEYNRKRALVNKVATVFGKEDFRKWIQEQVRKENLVRIKKKSSYTVGGPSPIDGGRSIKTPLDKSITQNDQKVNSENTTNNKSMQKGEKNSSKTTYSVAEPSKTAEEIYLERLAESSHSLVSCKTKSTTER